MVSNPKHLAKSMYSLEMDRGSLSERIKSGTPWVAKASRSLAMMADVVLLPKGFTLIQRQTEE